MGFSQLREQGGVPVEYLHLYSLAWGVAIQGSISTLDVLEIATGFIMEMYIPVVVLITVFFSPLHTTLTHHWLALV
jgi:hypothetical protein